MMPDHGGTPAPWSESEIDALADFVADHDTAAREGAAWVRDTRSDDPDEGALTDFHEVFVLNLGDRPGSLDADDELMDRFTLRPMRTDRLPFPLRRPPRGLGWPDSAARTVPVTAAIHRHAP